MSTTALISMAEYLETSYEPDAEYVDGVIVERNVGKKSHSKVQGRVMVWFTTTYPRVQAWVEQRVQTVPGRRCRIPDVCLTLTEPPGEIFEEAPFICIEILSEGDTISGFMEKFEEYAAFGVPYIWVIDPRRKKAYSFRSGSLEELHGDALLTSNPEIRLPLEEVFRGL
jgi:Uma2 family endonuclease